jgi:hypothetical protein
VRHSDVKTGTSANAVITPVTKPKAAEVMILASHASRPLMEGMAARAESLITWTNCSGASMPYE